MEAMLLTLYRLPTVSSGAGLNEALMYKNCASTSKGETGG